MVCPIPELTIFHLSTAVGNISVTFFDESSGDKTVLSVPIGKSVLDVAIDNKLNIEGQTRRLFVACYADKF